MAHLLGRVPFLQHKPNTQGRGLKNTGNTCFLNSVLQSLNSVKSFHVYLANETNEFKQTGQALHETLQELSFNTTQPYIPTKLSSIPSLKKNFLNNEQHDAHEFLHFLFSSLEEEEAIHGPTQKKPLHLAPRTPFIVQFSKNRNPFSGLLASNILCSNCGTKENYFLDKFSSLSLSPPPGLTPLKKSSSSPSSPSKKGMVYCTLEECLEQFTSEDVLQAVECHVCSSMEIIKAQSLGNPTNLEAKAPFLKQKLFVGRPPPALCLHIRRLLGNMKQSYKVGIHVRFPMILNMTPFCLPHHIWGDNQLPRKEDGDETQGEWEKEGEGEEEEEEKEEGLKAWANGPKMNYVGGSDPHLKTFISTSPPTCLHVPDSVKQKSQHIPSQLPSATAPILIPGTSTHLAHEPFHMQPPRISSEILYRLMAVIVHHGSESGGHFTTYRRLLNGVNGINTRDEYLNFIQTLKSPSSGKGKIGNGICGIGSFSGAAGACGIAGSNPTEDVWVHLSDENCRIVQDIEEILSCQAYMLFYEKI